VFFAIIGVISKSQGVFRFLAYISMTINRFPSLGMNCISHAKKQKSRFFKSLTWTTTILLSVLFTIVMHPQEYLPSVLSQILEMIF
ncbi:hypothetical protein RB620_29295, partial [Paenibacillus sp. LHD-117]|uniref:hypothetical protein n=1 Tax=Paenibacillus sp. LHD-117 TaxID=3071412 RepID=UPI0027E1713B